MSSHRSHKSGSSSHSTHGGNSHSHGASDKKNFGPQDFDFEWFWACHNCREHAAMSLGIGHCPGCQHGRCSDCPVERIKILEGNGRYYHGWGTATQSKAATTPEVPGVNYNPISMRSAPARAEQVDLAEDPLLVFTTLSLSPTPKPGSSFHSTYSSGIFSTREPAYESVTDIDSQNTESDDSADTGEINEVIRMLDIHLVSVLSGNLDLAARLIPKIHDLLDGENVGNRAFLGSRNQDFFSHYGGERSKGKQGTSGSTSSALANRNAPSSSSPQKHGRGSEDSNGHGEGNDPNKKPRRESDRNSGSGNRVPGGNPAGTPNSNQVENPSDDPGGIFGDNIDIIPYERDPDDPREDPTPIDPPDEPPDFACHFYKRDHIKYGPWNKKYVMCVSSRMTQLRRIKRHFETVHRPPQCHRCYSLFQNHNELKDHYQEPIACLKGLSSSQEGIDDGGWEEISFVLRKQGQRGINDVSRWYKIWQILFPDVEKPSSPWNEPPAYVARLATNVEEYLSKLKRRIDEDIKRGILPPEKRIHERYLYHFQQLWEEDNAACGLIQLQRSGRNQQEEIRFPSFAPMECSNTNRVSSIGGNCPQLPLQTSGVTEHGSLSNPLVEDFQRNFRPMDPMPSSRYFSSSMTVPVSDYLNPTQELLDLPIPDSNFGRQDFPPVNLNIDPNEALLNQFCAYNLDLEAAGSSIRSTSPPRENDPNMAPESSPQIEQSPHDYYMSDDFVANLLQIENEMPEAMGSWKHKNSGNGVLRQP